MVAPAGGDHLPSPTNPDPLLISMMLKFFVTSLPDLLVDANSDMVDKPLVMSSLKELTADCPKNVVVLDNPMDSIPKPKDSIAHDELKDKRPPIDNTTIKGWKSVLMGKGLGEVDPNVVPVCFQTKEGTTIEFPEKVLDHILLNMNNTLVGKISSLRPTVEMVRKWVLDKWRLKGSVSVSGMPATLFLFKFTIEEDVVMVLSGC
ncbi:hypothetical protein SUGI_0755210 [Cryptomeria japonica]|nr:hypothetical protein SUGI_0755210 [Cryptomeria japonica]